MASETKDLEKFGVSSSPNGGGALDISGGKDGDLAVPGSGANTFELGKLPPHYWKNVFKLWGQQWYIVIGNVFEWYEFNIYGYLAAQKNINFFQGNSNYTWAVYALTFIMRPVGALFFGWMGDVHGRRIAMLISMIGMTFATVLPGCLPTYYSSGETGGKIGLAFLIIARTLQGFCVGGEVGSASVQLSEIEQKQLLAAGSGNVLIGSYVGSLLAIGVVNILTNLLTPHQMNLWGWRIPYLIAIVPGVLGIVYRSKLNESHMFTEQMGTVEERKKRANQRFLLILELFRDYPKNAAAVIFGISGFAASTYVAGTWGITFVREFGTATAKDTLNATVISLLTSIAAMFVAIPLGDMYGVGRTMSVFILLALPYTIMVWVGMTLQLDNRTACFVWLASTGILKVLSGFSLQLYWTAELFPTHLRVTGFFCYNFTFALFGGLGSLVCNAIVKQSIWGPMIFNILAAFVSCVTIVCVYLAHRSGSIVAAHIRPEKY